jgi:type I restriction enzyme S subunit
MARSLSAAQIPIGWEYNLLDNYADRRSGHTPSKSFPEYWDGGIKWISLADSYRLDKGYIYETDNQISEEGIRNSSAELHPAETVVLSRDAGIGKSGVMAVPMAVSQHFIAWRCDNNKKLNSWFLYNWLQLNKSEFERQAVGSTIKTIGLPYFKKLRIAIPPYEEQKKIAQILSTWDTAIATTEKLLENSQKQKKALMQQLLTGKKRFSEFKTAWEHKHISELCKIGAGQSAPQDEKYFINGKYDFLRVSDIGAWPYKFAPPAKDKINEIAVKELNFKKIAKGATLFTKSGASLLLNQRVLLEKDTFIVSHLGYAKPNDGVESEFLYYQLCNVDFNGLASGTSLPALQLSVLSKIKVNLPSIEEQKKISRVLSLADNEIQLLRGKLNFLEVEKKALMQQLLTGKKRVKLEG